MIFLFTTIEYQVILDFPIWFPTWLLTFPDRTRAQPFKFKTKSCLWQNSQTAHVNQYFQRSIAENRFSIFLGKRKGHSKNRMFLATTNLKFTLNRVILNANLLSCDVKLSKIFVTPRVLIVYLLIVVMAAHKPYRFSPKRAKNLEGNSYGDGEISNLLETTDRCSCGLCQGLLIPRESKTNWAEDTNTFTNDSWL